jgi:hypothetical protein
MCFEPNIYNNFFLHIMLELKSIELVEWVLQKRISHVWESGNPPGALCIKTATNFDGFFYVHHACAGL